MDDIKFQPLEPENPSPESLPNIPEQTEPLDDQPVIQELSFENAPAPAKEPAMPEVAEEVQEPVEASEETVSIDASAEDSFLEIPDTHPEIEADHQAMDAHGMLEHAQTEEAFNMAMPEEPELTFQPIPLPAEDPIDREFQENEQDFEAMFQSPASVPAKEKTNQHAVGSKGRPKKKKGEGLLGIPSILVTFVWLALILIIGVTAGRMLWICAADVLAFGREDKVVTVTIYESDSLEDVIDKLHEGGLIRYKGLFSFYADISDAEEDIKPGIYDLNTRYDYHALVNFMSPPSSREVIKVTIPEGYTCRQIFDLLEENRICTSIDAAAYAANGELSDYWFLEGLERGAENCLEGYLFPDTYEFYKNSTPREAIERMLDNFAYRFDEEMLAQLETLNSKVTDGTYGIREIVIIASLIERESAAPGESPAVSGVIYNRLFRWGSNPRYLNIDASIVYAQGGNNEHIDTKLDDPYNTYLYEGLTPGPIANPGLSSLKAALNPESHNYYYYVLNPSTGMHQFSTSYEEHTGYVRQFAAATED